jgi:hypothetical protein
MTPVDPNCSNSASISRSYGIGAVPPPHARRVQGGSGAMNRTRFGGREHSGAGGPEARVCHGESEREESVMIERVRNKQKSI